MSRFSGRQQRGAMKQYREMKHEEAVLRNNKAQATHWICGHIHGTARAARCSR